jgi:alpha-L-fucosidase
MLGAAGTVAVGRLGGQKAGNPAIAAGPFTGTRDSLQAYKIPAWFGEAKFGIWSHWGPQSAIGDGDWYARRMYCKGTAQYD